MSYKPEVQTINDQNWYSNSLAFATSAEASAWAQDRMMRWTQVNDVRVVQSTEPVSARWEGDKAVLL